MQKNHEGHKECETVNLMYSNPKVVVNGFFGMHCQPPEGGTTTHGGWLSLVRRTHPTAVSGGDDVRVPTSYRWLRLRHMEDCYIPQSYPPCSRSCSFVVLR